MQFIPRALHGVLDYLMGFLLASTPWIFGFADNYVAMYFALVLGTIMILYSMMTDYEAGALRMIPFSFHLGLDLIAGAALLGSPLIIPAGAFVNGIFVVFGILEIGAALCTRHEAGVPKHA